MSKLFKNLWFWVVLLHLIVVVAWYYLAKITPEPTYTEPSTSTPAEREQEARSK